MTARNWPCEMVGACLVRLPLPSIPTLKTKHYKSSGAYPIIDQGKELVVGWTDDPAGVISAPLPLVVFGDHTRVLKYIDFPFVRGADGTQLMKPRDGIDPLFFYYACLAVDLPSRGYNRHFATLRERSIPVPPQDEQVKIAGVLRLIERHLHLQRSELLASDALKRTAVHLLFTRGLRGEVQRETEIGPMPESWRPCTVLDLCEIWSGGTPRKSVPEYWIGPIPWVSGKDLKASTLHDATDHLNEAAVGAGSRLAPAGAVLVLVRGMGLAKDLPVTLISRPMAFNQDIKALVSRGGLSGPFIRSAIYAGKERLLSRIVPSAHGTMTLNLNDVETFKVPCPSNKDEADEIAAMLDAIEYKIDLHRRKRAMLHELFDALLHKLMTGEVRVQDLDLSALAVTPSMEAAA